MSPELRKAVTERVDLGFDDEKIREELRQAGHQEAIINEVLEAVHSGSTTPSPVPTADGSVVFSSARQLVSEGFGFAKERMDLVVALAIPLMLIPVLELFFPDTPGTEITTDPVILGLVGVAGLVGIVVYLLVLVGVLYATVQADQSKITLREGWQWARKNIWGFIWVQMLSSMVVFGGFVLFIIPGIILSLYVYFTQFLYVKEGVRGMQAVLRSRDLVKGRWWSLFWVLLKVGLILMIVFIGIGIIIGILTTFIPENQFTDTLVKVVIQALSAFVTVLGLYVGSRLLTTLVTQSGVPRRENPQGSYIILAVIGLLAPVFIAVSVYLLIEANPELLLEETYTEEVDVSNEEAKQRALELRNLE